jgi:hypothetical protein
MPAKTIKLKNELPELLEAVCNHPDWEDWLKDAVWDAVSDRDQGVTYSPNWWRACLGAIKEREVQRQPTF